MNSQQLANVIRRFQSAEAAANRESKRLESDSQRLREMAKANERERILLSLVGCRITGLKAEISALRDHQEGLRKELEALIRTEKPNVNPKIEVRRMLS